MIELEHTDVWLTAINARVFVEVRLNERTSFSSQHCRMLKTPQSALLWALVSHNPRADAYKVTIETCYVFSSALLLRMSLALRGRLAAMGVKTCAHCGAQWIDGVHYWSGTGKRGNELDLAGLVCNTSHGDPAKCINPALNCPGGDTWEGRAAFINAMLDGSGMGAGG